MLKINDKTYCLPDKHYINSYNNKTQIMLVNSFSENMNHFKGWCLREGGLYKKTTPYSIDVYGNIYEHYPPEFYSNLFGIPEIDKHLISITIENEGWLEKEIDGNEYINYIGNIYNRKDDIVYRKWRGKEYWSPYSLSQLNSTIDLCYYICDTFSINREAVDNNTVFSGAYDFNGVLFKSNYEKFYSDLSPAWDYETFKNKIEKK
jgi:hypothetical protein